MSNVISGLEQKRSYSTSVAGVTTQFAGHRREWLVEKVTRDE
jgi:hypothetical protein